jgi:2-polyprenyl-3-methyl-5-hydroxy-6-metoxy-1,4-benzoquinol methylase
MPVPGKFSRLLEDIGRVDPKLAETTLQLELNWKTGDLRDTELTELVAGVLRAAIDNGLFSLPAMVEGFNTFAHDFHVRQLNFLRSGSYRARDYDEVSRKVYSDEQFMCTVYYPALVFSYLGAPNYRHMLRRFDQTLAAWRGERVARLLDVASGHAFLLLFALNQLQSAIGVGTDISPAAGRFAPAMHQITGWAPSRFRFAVTDVLAEGHPDLAEPFDAVICCELLEHVPEPALFVQAIRRRLRPGGRLFLSAAVRMESVDHLTLFESTQKVASLLEHEGFDVVKEMSVPFVTRAPSDAAQWRSLLDDPQRAATFVADCVRRP